MWQERYSRRFAIFLVVLVLVSCSVWAFPGRKPKLEELNPEQTQTSLMKEQEKESVDAKTDSSEQSRLEETKPLEVESLIEELNEIAKDVPSEEDRELLEIIAQQSAEVLEANNDNKYLSDRVDAAESANAAQADEIARLQGMLKKEKGVHPFVLIGGKIGFEDGLPQYGVEASMGLKFGSGFMMEAGVGYDIGGFKGTVFPWSIDNLTAGVSIGWMW